MRKACFLLPVLAALLVTVPASAAFQFFNYHAIKADWDDASCVFATDIDGDGDVDVLGGSGTQITWWENLGTTPIVWSEHIISSDFYWAWSVYAADVNGDSYTDILGTSEYHDDITWWENDGSQNFTEHTIKGDFDGASSVYATDLDGDGDVDVLGAAFDDDDITWWENTGGSPPSFIEHTIDGNFDGANSLYATDVDGDSDTDVLGAGSSTVSAGEITWWENTGGTPPSFSEHSIKGNFRGATFVYATDIDGDGDADVLGGAGPYDFEVTWWENDGGTTPSFTEHTIKDNLAPSHLHAADVDGDGDVDVLAAAGNDLTWWENSPSGSPPPADPIDWTEHWVEWWPFRYASSVHATDLDGDGDVDVLGTASFDDEISWWENDGSQSFTKHAIRSDFEGASSIYATDLDGDGDTDVLGTAIYDNDITWWENNSSGNPPPADPVAWTEHTIEGEFKNPRSVHAIDVDGDGDTDVLGAAQGDHTTWWENSPSGKPPPADPIAWTLHPIDTDFVGASSVYGADVDGDGRADVLGAASSGQLAWWENTPSGNPPPADPVVWTEHTIKGDYYIASSVYASDVDGDGDVDVLGTAWGDNDITWWANDGTPANGGWTEHTIKDNFNGASSVYATDLDGDADVDVLGTANGDDDITWWENNPSGSAPPADPITWTEHTIRDNFMDASCVYAADVDGDADTDVLGAYEDGGIYWWENSPSGDPPPADPIDWIEHQVDVFWDGSVGVCATDVDGDGDTDVLGVAGFPTHEIVWWENMRDFTISSLTPLQTVMPGTPADYQFALDNDNPTGFVPVTLNAVGLPAGAAASFDPNPVRPPASSVMTITTDISSLGRHVVEVDGTIGYLARSTSVGLVVGERTFLPLQLKNYGP